ncbi:MAG: GyrI-like domain-containing protein [Spirochaetota bacterium]
MSKYEVLKQPRISKISPQKVYVTKLKGEPERTAGKAFGRLYRLSYKLDEERSAVPVPFPRARWLSPLSKPQKEWEAEFAVPASLAAKPVPTDDIEEPKAKLVTWKYGFTAEILHVGSYEAEAPTIKKLKEFITAQGYEISGYHEEVYLKGPGMFFRGDPNTYQTIIRYPVKKKTKP